MFLALTFLILVGMGFFPELTPIQILLWMLFASFIESLLTE